MHIQQHRPNISNIINNIISNKCPGFIINTDGEMLRIGQNALLIKINFKWLNMKPAQ